MSQFAYSYGGVGNRTVCLDTVFDSTQTMTYDAKNRLTAGSCDNEQGRRLHSRRY